MFAQRMERAFSNAVQQVTPLSMKHAPIATAVELVNFVTSVCILPSHLSLSMKHIALFGSGAVKFTPSKFHAIVLRFGDSSPAGNATALIFGTGKIIIVGATNKEHARFASQQYRMFIERIPYVIIGLPPQCNYEGVTIFEKFSMYNVVGTSSLGFRPDLFKLQQLYPGASEWQPELFPGLTLQVWLRPKQQCRCKKRKHKHTTSCACNSTCLVFDSGKLVVTGVSNCSHVVAICDRIRLFFSGKDELHDHSQEVPRHMRFNHRTMRKLQQLEVDFIGTYNVSKIASESAENILKRITDRTHAISSLPLDTELPPIFQACDAGQVDMVRFLVSINPNARTLVDQYGHTAFERVQLNSGGKHSDTVKEQLLRELK